MRVLSETNENIIRCDCGCVYQYDNKDLRMKVGMPYPFVNCPKCSTSTYLVYVITTEVMQPIIEIEGEKDENNNKD